ATCMPELVHDHQNGLLVPPDDSFAMAQRLTWLLQNPDVAARWREASGQMAQHYGMSRMIQEVMAVYYTAVYRPHHHAAARFV
ncbi:MAG: hypothetical protein KDE56_10040, partial [Anaerolineales bacterium]|nr:hypothetical protein [Anaerolineales bacterium]